MSATLELLRDELAAFGHLAPEYVAKQLHPVPVGVTVDRQAFVLEQCRGRRVLEFGASGPLSLAVRGVVAGYLGVDRMAGDQVVAWDLDDIRPDLPTFDAELVLCGEVLEHLSNPGWFLTRLRRQYPDVPVLVTVPNAHTTSALRWLVKSVENVNRDHVAWYSYQTLATLLGRAGYTVQAHGWYNGPPLIAEGLIVIARSIDAR